VTDLGGGSFRVDGFGIPGFTYRLQYTDSLSPADWQELTTVTSDLTGRFSYTDTGGSPSRFYRTVHP
jgi:hypothetical protein